jgi:exodeoxyribonuclease V alpha subunit
VARLLAAGVRDVALAAPTGRAAQRLGESVARGLGPDAPPGMTLHRLLGARGGDFAHHARAPLPHGAVLVDEASMVDARLLDALLAALPPSARLILLGDADQLPSVDAGQALADLVAGLPPSAVARLHTSFRMSPSDPDGAHVLAAAAAIRAGDADALLTGKARRLRHEDRDADQLAGAPRGATFHPCEPSALPAVLDAWFERMTTEAFWRAATRDHRFDPTLGAFAPESDAALRDLLAGFGRSRLLAATRGDAAGTTAIGSYLHARLAGAGQRTDGGAEFVPGEPVVMTANDHARGLWNGDVGVIARVRTDGDGDAGHGRWRVVFARGTALVPLPIDALRDRLERAWAITVHKSQGSEADDVTLVLPADDSPLLTRELLYTAVTRARRGVRLVGRRAVLQAALGRRAARTTGLAARLLAPALPAPEASS